ELSETVSVTLGAIAGDPQITLGLTTAATGTITDNDTATVSISGTPTVTEGRDLTFTVTQSAVSSTDTTINYSFGGTATAGLDFTSTTTSVTIPAGATTATIAVPTINDGLLEPTETVIVTLGSTNNPQITLASPTAATGTILDAQGTATASISGAPIVTEGAALSFTVTLSAPTSTDTTIPYSFSGTANGGNDFLNTTTSVPIPAGATTASIVVPTIIDALVEPTETVIVTLKSTSNPQITLGLPADATG